MNTIELRKKISYQEPSLLKTIKEAEFVRQIGNSVIQATSYESTRESTSISDYSMELQSAQQNLLSNIKNLEKVHDDISKKEKELEESIKVTKRDLEDHKNLKNSEFETVKKEYANKLKLAQDEANEKYKKETNLNKSAISHKEKETNNILTRASKNQEKAIKEAQQTFNERSKSINSEVLETKKELESSKQLKIKELQNEYNIFEKETNNLEKELSKSENNIPNSEISKLKNKITEKKTKLKALENRLNENIIELENIFSKRKAEKDDWATLELATASKIFNDFKNTKTTEVSDIKSDETDKFAKLKEMRATSISDLRSEQKAIYKAIESEKENIVSIKEKEVINSINEKEISTTDKIESLKVNFELERKNMLELANKSLINSNFELNNAIEKYYTFFNDNESLPSVLINS